MVLVLYFLQSNGAYNWYLHFSWETEKQKLRMFPGLVYILKLLEKLKISIDMFWSVISTPLPAKIIEQEEKAVNAGGV